MHQPLRRILTPEDRATHANWMRVVATLYACAALLLLGPPWRFPVHRQSSRAGPQYLPIHRSDPGFLMRRPRELLNSVRGGAAQ